MCEFVCLTSVQNREVDDKDSMDTQEYYSVCDPYDCNPDLFD